MLGSPRASANHNEIITGYIYKVEYLELSYNDVYQ